MYYHLSIWIQILSIEAYQLWISTIAIIASIVIMIWQVDRARKKDIKSELAKKADIKIMQREFKIRDERITKVEELSVMQDRYLKETLEEHYSILDTVQHDIKEILKRLK